MEKISIILLEDNPMDAELTRALLESEGFELDLKQVDCEGDFVELLKKSKPDLIISDYSLPSYNGKAALNAAQKLSPRTPFIFYSGTIGEEAAIDALKLGATDYVLKQRPKRLLSAIQRALVEVKLKERQEAAERKIQAQAQLLDLAREAIIVRDVEDRVLFWNQGAERLYGYSSNEAEGRLVHELIDQTQSTAFAEAKKQTFAGGYWEGELDQKTKGDRSILVESHWTLVKGKDGQAERILSISTDITEKKQLEKQFLRAQRLESVGTLASGIAHDLNNILAPIFMASEILRDENLRPEAANMVNTIQLSARRGADVVKQVLTFVRGSEGKRTPIL
ncbi:MAG: sensor hybrid histidine kinase, partial [Verrucomicrobiales bacterium]|nr:sensor hybrid histidine kinase [Verrucomicrobiales bacterium]